MVVTAIILKYRFSHEQLIHNTEHLGVDDYIIVDNSKNNLGTAGGYAKGMKQIRNGFIWLLDEDNIPEPDALKKLRTAWKLYGGYNRCLASYRKGYDKIYDIYSIIGSENSCLGLNLFNYKKTRENLYPFMTKAFKLESRFIPVAMYGGMFFHSDLLKIIGYPNEKLFMYCDDFEWSYRITKSGGKIALVRDSIIHEPKSEGNVYYNTRNHLIFQKQFVTDRFKFWINYQAYKFYLLLKGNKLKRRALRDGYIFP